MVIKDRVNKALFLLKLNGNKEYMSKLGVKDVSTFKKKVISEK